MSQADAYFAITETPAGHDPVAVRGWAAMPLHQEERNADGSVTSRLLTDEELLQKAAAHTPPGSMAVRLDVTDEEWNSRPTVNPVLSSGKIIQGPSPTIPLQEQARNAMQQVQQQAAITSAMGETFGPEMQAHVRALRAILNGTDTTSTTLPTAPADPTV